MRRTKNKSELNTNNLKGILGVLQNRYDTLYYNVLI